jgi:hypothetical protein
MRKGPGSRDRGSKLSCQGSQPSHRGKQVQRVHLGVLHKLLRYQVLGSYNST